MTPAAPQSKLADKPSAPRSASEHRPWPVDPNLNQRVLETQRRIQRIRTQLARHVLPARKRG